MGTIDRLDAELLSQLAADARAGVGEIAARAGTTRNTVQARLARLQRDQVVQAFTLQLNLPSIGTPVLAFVSMELAQNALPEVVATLETMPHVLEVHAITGTADLVARLAARDHEQLQELVQGLLGTPGVVRTSTVIALTTPIPMRLAPLLKELTADRGRGRAVGIPDSHP